MSNVPTSTFADVPACGEQATTRIETFAPRDGRAHGHLDGIMYLCDRHADDFLEMAGDTTTQRTALTARDILCGAGWDFVAGRAIEPETSDDTLDLLQRIDRRLKDADKAYAYGMADGIEHVVHSSDLADVRESYRLGRQVEVIRAGHAFAVKAIEDRVDWWAWTCRCGWLTLQAPTGFEQTPIEQRLIEHATEATAIDVRTALALDVDGCSCPAEIGEHRHKLYVRRLASTGKLAHIVVEALWYDHIGSARKEVLCWPLSEGNLAKVQQWVSDHAARWEDGTPVVVEDLARRGAGWLR